MGDNPLAKARGLSPHTCGQTIVYLLRNIFSIIAVNALTFAMYLWMGREPWLAAALVFSTSLRTLKMLMHLKPC